MRKQKTGKANRINYTYYTADGTTITLRPGEEGVSQMDIAVLHQADDEAFNSQRRENYHVPVHYQAYQGEGNDFSEDRNGYLADESANPETLMVEAESAADFRSRFASIWDSFTPKQRDLARKKATGLSNTVIASEEGVSEAAIRNRLKKIQKKFDSIREGFESD